MIVVAAGDDGMARVAHQVFLSYAKGDADSASHVCVLLEQEGINCWLASRDAATRKDKAAANLQGQRPGTVTGGLTGVVRDKSDATH